MPIYPYNSQGQALELLPAKENWQAGGTAIEVSDKS
jgi:hypothetical protein